MIYKLLSRLDNLIQVFKKILLIDQSVIDAIDHFMQFCSV